MARLGDAAVAHFIPSRATSRERKAAGTIGTNAFQETTVVPNNAIRVTATNQGVAKPTDCGVALAFQKARTRRLHRTGAVRPRCGTRKST